MPERLFRLYQRKRVININANVIIAGIGSTLIVVALIWMLKIVFGTNWHSLGYTAFSVVADVILDVAIFTLLHWVANHWRPLKGRTDRERMQLGAAAPPHLEDTARVQLERMVLSPLYYIIAAGGTEGLQRLGIHPAWAVLIAYPIGLLLTRTIHTIWGYRSGTFHDHDVQEKRRKLAALQAERRRRHEARQRRAATHHRAR